MTNKKTAAIVQQYLDLGLRVYLLKPGQKTGLIGHISPIGVWQAERNIEWATKYNKTLLENLTNENLAIPMGQTIIGGGHIHALDFDNVDFYHHWKAANPSLANTPTQATSRGFHVLFRMPTVFLNGKSELVSFIGSGWYIMVEPSVHPDGSSYEWIINPFTTPIVEVSAPDNLGIAVDRLEWDPESYSPYDDEDEDEFYLD